MARVAGDTLVELFSRRVADSGERPALFVPNPAQSASTAIATAWLPLTWNELGVRVFRLAAALRNAAELHAMRQVLGAEAEGKSDAEVRRLYEAKIAAYQKQGEAAAAAAPTAAEAEQRERDTRAEREDAVKQMTGKSLEELENMTDEEAEALQRELEKKYGGAE